MEQNDYEMNEAFLEASASVGALEKQNYDDKYILKNLLSGKTRDEIAKELNHKNFRTIDMYMRRRGYIWSSERQLYILKDNNINNNGQIFSNSRVHKIIDLFSKGMDPNEIAKLVSMKDHRAIAEYMKSKGYIWSTQLQNYALKKGEVSSVINNSESLNVSMDYEDDRDSINTSIDDFSNKDDLSSKLKNLIPMLEMIEKNKDKLFDLLGTRQNDTIPRYVVGGVTITKSLCMSYPLAELIKEFSKEKNLSQKEIFEVALIEFLKKYGYEHEVNSLFK